MVITHLVLNDLLKVRSDIYNVAMLIDDKDPRVNG